MLHLQINFLRIRNKYGGVDAAATAYMRLCCFLRRFLRLRCARGGRLPPLQRPAMLLLKTNFLRIRNKYVSFPSVLLHPKLAFFRPYEHLEHVFPAAGFEPFDGFGGHDDVVADPADGDVHSERVSDAVRGESEPVEGIADDFVHIRQFVRTEHAPCGFYRRCSDHFRIFSADICAGKLFS